VKVQGQGLRIAIAAGGVLVSAGLIAAGAMTMPAGNEYGPSLSPGSMACFAAFFALNPPHLLLLFVRLPLHDTWAGLVTVTVDLVWWWVAAGALARFVARRRAHSASPGGGGRD
jgi:hypothetical protein